MSQTWLAALIADFSAIWSCRLNRVTPSPSFAPAVTRISVSGLSFLSNSGAYDAANALRNRGRPLGWLFRFPLVISPRNIQDIRCSGTCIGSILQCQWLPWQRFAQRPVVRSWLHKGLISCCRYTQSIKYFAKLTSCSPDRGWWPWSRQPTGWKSTRLYQSCQKQFLSFLCDAVKIYIQLYRPSFSNLATREAGANFVEVDIALIALEEERARRATSRTNMVPMGYWVDLRRGESIPIRE